MHRIRGRACIHLDGSITLLHADGLIDIPAADVEAGRLSEPWFWTALRRLGVSYGGPKQPNAAHRARIVQALARLLGGE